MTDTRNTSCDERIDANLASRIEDLAEITAAIDNDGGIIDGDEVDYDGALDRLDEYALCLDIKTTMTVQISTGGPGDQFEIEVIKSDCGWELADSQATYRFLDWFDGATRRTDDEAVMRYLSAMVERLSY
jgi:hypothetical protein